MRALLVLLAACGSASPTTHTITTTTTSSTIVGVAGPPLGDPGPPPAAGTVEADVLALVNDYRKRAGMPPVVLDNTLSKGCHEHANYMVLNRGTHAMYHLNAHHQDPALPGATKEGAECGRHSDLHHSVANIPDAVHDWMSSLYHRQPLIAPYNGRIALGYAKLPSGDRYAVALHFVLAPYDSRLYPVAFPGDGNTDVPVDFRSEVPNPLPRVPFAGHPFTLLFPPDDPVTNVTATLVDDANRPVPIFLSTPEQPASTYSPNNHGIVGLIPQKPLRANTRYTATVTATWKTQTRTWTSSWTTKPRVTVDASDEVAMMAALGKPALVRGRIKQASDVSGVYHLTIHENWLSKVLTRVTVVVAKSAVSIPRQSLVGKVIEVEITPRIYLKSIQLDASLNGPGVWRLVK